MPRAYEYRHTVSFEESNVVGNVYFSHFMRWQGRCREMFLREHAPDVVDQFGRGLALFTTRCSCEFVEEVRPFDEIAVEMRLSRLTQTRFSFTFEYWRSRGSSPELVATGEQEVACVRRVGAATEPALVPESLRKALLTFGGDGPRAAARTL
jgi:enediyne biosynthesis thioesterase